MFGPVLHSLALSDIFENIKYHAPCAHGYSLISNPHWLCPLNPSANVYENAKPQGEHAPDDPEHGATRRVHCVVKPPTA